RQRRAAEALDGVGDAGDGGELAGEGAEVAPAQLAHERLLVAEVEVDRGGGVLDAVRDAAHGDRVVALLGEHLTSGIEDLAADLLAFAGASFCRSQTCLRNLTVLS